eukprot:801469-Pyramimonas_sp.AAC.1
MGWWGFAKRQQYASGNIDSTRNRMTNSSGANNRPVVSNGNDTFSNENLKYMNTHTENNRTKASTIIYSY